MQPTNQREADREPGAASLRDPWTWARHQVLALWTAQTRATIELLGRLAILPLRTGVAAWTQLAAPPRTVRATTADNEASDEPTIEPGDEPTDEATIDVTFRVPAGAKAHSAHVCGEFNDWSTTADPMNRLADGSFELTRTLPVGRSWRFRYLVDGTRWENDAAADDYPVNDFGDHDSVVDLRSPSTSRLVHRNPVQRL